LNNRCISCGVILENSSTKCQRCETNNLQNQSNSFIKPLFYLLDGLRTLFKNKKLLKLSILPLIITTFLLIMTYIIAIYFMISGLEIYLPVEETSSATKIVSKYALAFVGTITLMIMSFFMFLPLSSLVCIPFNDFISLETENITLGEDNSTQNQNILNEVKVGIKEIFKLLVFKVLVLIISLPVLIIPVVGQTAFFFILALITSIDFLDIIMARKKYTLSEKLSFLNKNSLAFILFSIPIMLLFWVPIVQILIIPAAAIGGTKFFLENQK
jgi:CysZ protein